MFILCPLVFSFENVRERGGVFSWEPERGTRLGVMPRSGGNADVRWFDTDPCYVFHPMNAYDDGDATVVDVARYGRLDFMTVEAVENPSYRDQNAARLCRWRIDRARGGVKTTPLDDIIMEFPRIDERLVGRRHRFGYTVAREPGLDDGTRPEWTAIRKYDLERGTTGIGPHLDDVGVLAGERDLRAFGSQGEQRLAVLALLLGEAELLEERRGVRPLLLLDDVLSELDPERRRILADRLRAGGQALVTSASANALPGEPAQTVTVEQAVDGTSRAA